MRVLDSGALPSYGSKERKLDIQCLKKDTKDKVPKGSSKKSKIRARKCQENKITKYFENINDPTEKVGIKVGNQTSQARTGQDRLVKQVFGAQ